jgi:hypothetical protein
MKIIARQMNVDDATVVNQRDSSVTSRCEIGGGGLSNGLTALGNRAEEDKNKMQRDRERESNAHEGFTDP